MTASEPSEAPSAGETAQLQGYLEIWKQTITVQQHFNELCWKIRGLALTALTFTLGAASLTAGAADRPPSIAVWDYQVDSSAVILAVGTLIWLAFYFVDDAWYHRLLKGSVKHGEVIERELQRHLPKAGLTKAISDASPLRLRPTRKTLHSKGKLRLFYWSIALILAGMAASLQFGANLPQSSPVNETVEDGEG